MDDIHTCHNECQRPICVAVREAVAAEREYLIFQLRAKWIDDPMTGKKLLDEVLLERGLNGL